MEFRQDHLHVAFAACAAAQAGGGVVLDDPGLYVAAHDLAEQGWLERRFVTHGELSWWWTPAAETAVGLSALTDVTGREN